MAENSKRTVALVAGILIPLLVGFALGYYIWGHGRNKPVDYKQVLVDAAAYVGSMEERNKELTTKVESLDAEVSILRQKGQVSGTQSQNIITTLNQRVSALEAENHKLRDQVKGLAHQADTTM
jgi:cell division protein FtsB